MFGFDRLAWILLVLVLLAALALRSVWKSGAHAKRVKIIWSAVVLIPLVGPLGWYILGRDRRRR